MNPKIWIKATRLPFLTATLVPVVLGSSIAWHNIGGFNWVFFWMTLIGIACFHIGTNLTNDFFDHLTKNDELNLTYTPFSGGSRVIQDGLIPPKKILYAALIFFAIGSLFGVYLAWSLKSIPILILGIVGILFGFFYTAGPFKIGYRGFGELVVGLCFGPLVVMGSYYVQAGEFSLIAVLASIPVGILITLVLYINEFPDRDADKQVNKKTLVVMLDKEKAIKLYHVLLAFTYFYIITCVVFKLFPYWSLIILLTLPMAIKMYFISKINFNKTNELLPANAMTIGLHLCMGLLISGAFILNKIF